MDSARGKPAVETAPSLSAGPVVLAWLTQFLVGTDLFVVAPLLPAIAASLGVSATSTGLLITAFSIAYVVASPFAGWLSDRWDRATVLTGALVLFSLANVGTALAPDYGLLLVTRVVAGVAAAATGPTVYALVSTRVRPQARAQVLAVVGSGLLTALWVGAPAGALLGRHVRRPSSSWLRARSCWRSPTRSSGARGRSRRSRPHLGCGSGQSGPIRVSRCPPSRSPLCGPFPCTACTPSWPSRCTPTAGLATWRGCWWSTASARSSAGRWAAGSPTGPGPYG
ncbi:MFS transporter [Streptomyces formicae]|uniref:MFS transporter n=1 Tax=Streptomyces formicae TaxID=1616117 RepID=A0ABY3WKI2_9ACTN|nr:MFS transporter [Streptomyces formicae]